MLQMLSLQVMFELLLTQITLAGGLINPSIQSLQNTSSFQSRQSTSFLQKSSTRSIVVQNVFHDSDRPGFAHTPTIETELASQHEKRSHDRRDGPMLLAVMTNEQLHTALGCTGHLALQAIAFPVDVNLNSIAEDVTYDGLWEELATFPQRNPRWFNVMMATTKTTLADITVQVAMMTPRGTNRLDWQRVMAFALFGFFYIGLVQWFFYVTVFTTLCPNAIRFANSPMEAKYHDTTGQTDLMKQVLLDNLGFQVFIYFPVFYIVKEIMQGSGTICSVRSPHDVVSSALAKYKKNARTDNISSMLIWIPGDALAFAAPMYLRLPIEHGISFGWTMFLSYMRGTSSK